jgi:hypothetical protein
MRKLLDALTSFRLRAFHPVRITERISPSHGNEALALQLLSLVRDTFRHIAVAKNIDPAIHPLATIGANNFNELLNRFEDTFENPQRNEWVKRVEAELNVPRRFCRFPFMAEDAWGNDNGHQDTAPYEQFLRDFPPPGIDEQDKIFCQAIEIVSCFSEIKALDAPLAQRPKKLGRKTNPAVTFRRDVLAKHLDKSDKEICELLEIEKVPKPDGWPEKPWPVLLADPDFSPIVKNLLAVDRGRVRRCFKA